MRKTSTLLAVGLVLGLWANQAWSVSQEPIQPIQPAVIKEPAKVELGKKLFFDPRLSRSGAISCNSCHNLAMGGSDNLKASIGHKWQQGGINSPTVLNSSLNIAQFWDGRAKDLREQAGGPIENPMEMASTHELAVQVLNSIPGYRAEFKQVFGKDTITIGEVMRYVDGPIADADAASLRHLEGAYAVDVRRAYWMGKEIRGATPAGFRVLDAAFECSADDDEAFYRDGVITDVDPRSFPAGAGVTGCSATGIAFTN